MTILPIEVVETDDILYFDHWWPKFYKRNSFSLQSQDRKIPCDEKVAFNVSTFMEFIYNEENCSHVVAKNYIEELIHHTFKLESIPPTSLSDMKVYPKWKRFYKCK